MSDLIPSTRSGGLLPSVSSDGKARRAIEQVDRQATIIEFAATRKMAMATMLGQTAKCHIASSVASTRQLVEVVPEAEPLFQAVDLQVAETLRSTLERATR